MRYLLGVALLSGCTSGTDPATATATSAAAVPVDELVIQPQPLVIVGPAGMPAMATATVTGSGSITELTGISLGDAVNFSIISPTCPTGSCTFMPGMPLGNGLSIVVGCTPAGMKFTTLDVTGNASGMATTSVQCVQTAAGPNLAVSDPPRVFVDVGETGTATLSLTNTGDAGVTVSLTMPASEWSIAMCKAPQTCAIAAQQTLQIPAMFAPTIHGDRDLTVDITTNPNVGTRQARFRGTGVGGVLRVDDPPAPFSHNFGTLAKGQMSTFAVAMTNLGNVPIQITPTPAGAVPPVLSIPTAPVDIADGSTDSFEVTCGSMTPGGPFTATVMLDDASAKVYQRNTDAVTFTCAVANTTLQVAPNPIDFDRLRVGAPPAKITVTLTNPAGGDPMTIDSIRLRGNPPALALGEPSIALPAALADAAMLTIPLTLDTATDVDLANVALEITVTETEQATLEIPVIGEVGTPKVKVTPNRLALGTVCIGTQVTGTVTMTNTGTLELLLQPPAMSDDSFTPRFTHPTDYPAGGAPLLVSDTATVEVVPSATSAGPLTGMLEWDVDAPLAPFQIPVTVDLIEEGTAVSPASMEFGAADLNVESALQLVTLENCGTDPAIVTYSGVRASSGSAGSWRLDPGGDQRQLNPDSTMRIMVAFRPREPGRHVAELPIDVDGVEHVVTLDGEGIGTLVDKTSFYACGCSGGGPPARGWPLAAAIALVIGRRRRVSARRRTGSS